MELPDWAFEDTELSLTTMAARATLSIPMFDLDRAIASANGLLLREAATMLLPSLDPVLALTYPDALGCPMRTLQEFNRVLRASVALEDRLREFAERWAELPPIELVCLYRYQFAQDQADREDALRQLAGRIAWRTSLEAREAIRRRAIQDQRSVEAIKLDEVMAGLALSIGVLELEHTIRQGRTWITGADGKKRPVRPVELPFEGTWRWLANAAIANAEASVREVPARMTEDVLDRLRAPHGCEFAGASHLSVALGGSSDWGGEPDDQRIAVLLASSTPRQREILLLLAKGFTTPEIAGVLGCAPETIRVQLARLRKKIGAMERG